MDQLQTARSHSPPLQLRALPVPVQALVPANHGHRQSFEYQISDSHENRLCSQRLITRAVIRITCVGSYKGRDRSKPRVNHNQQPQASGTQARSREPPRDQPRRKAQNRKPGQ
jgi:hypothetical protein